MPQKYTRRRFLPTGLVLSASLTLLAGLFVRCAELPVQACTKCVSECPGELVCINKVCVHQGESNECDAVATGDGGSGSSETTNSGSNGQPQGGTGGSAGAGATPPLDPCDPPPSTCNPEFSTARELQTECADSFSFTLEAGCECDEPDTDRRVKWTATEEIEGLALSEDGVLSGSLPDGEYTFLVAAEIDGIYETQDIFTLLVQDRCWVSFVTDNPDGEPHVVAGRLNSGEITALPEAPGDVLVSFDTSPEGRFVARISDTEVGPVLDLVEFEGVEMFSHLIDVSGSYLAHAFSHDARWLALVSTGADDTQQTLALVELDGEPEVVASRTISFEEHLTWSDAGLLYVGRRASRRVVLERTVEDGTLGAETVIAATQSQEGETYYDLIVGDGFYVVLTSHHLVFVDGHSDPVVHELPDTLSPDVRWLSNDAGTDLPGSVIEAIDSPDPTRPFATASECDLVRAWSSDGSTFVCSGGAGAFVYGIDPDASRLANVRLNLPAPFPGESSRVALSATGRWLAMVPDQGLVLAPAAYYPTHSFDTPVLGPPEGTPEWDFYFTPAEEHLIVQRGRGLFVVSLDEESFSDPWEVEGVTLPAVPICTGGWDHEQRDLWCGAPRFRGNVLLSPGERHLAFVDDSGDVQVIDLVARRAVNLGPASSSLFEPNLQFL